MNRYFVVFATIVVAVSARSARQGWAAPTTVPPPTVAPGWPAPTSPPGWAAPPANSIVATADGSLAAAATGWAATSQNDELLGLDIAADTTAASPTVVSQDGVIAQNTAITPTEALAVQTVDVNQIAYGAQALDTTVLGGDLASASFSGWAGAAGEALSSADAATSILVNKP